MTRHLCGPRHDLWFGAVGGVAFLVLDTVSTLAGGSWWPERPGALAWALLVAQGLVCLSLVFNRMPLVPVAAIAVFTLAVTLLAVPGHALHPVHGDVVWAPYVATAAAYPPVLRMADRRRALAAVALLALVAARPWDPSVAVATIGVLRIAPGPLVAMYVDARRRLVRALTERAERAEREQHLLAEQARSAERARLAGEMHDVVSHRVSLMVLQAGALRVTATDEHTRRAAEELREAGCRALDELRDLVGILRSADDGPDAGPAAADPTVPAEPAAGGIAALVAESSAGGAPAELVEEGDPGLASPVVARTVHRVVREALTNARKHAPGARVTVRVRYDPERVRLVVRNTVATGPVDPALVATGSGLGLTGLRQRVELVHGTLDAAPLPDGGFGVEVVLPAFVPTAQPDAASGRVRS